MARRPGRHDCSALAQLVRIAADDLGVKPLERDQTAVRQQLAAADAVLRESLT
ncbi:MAG: hypothetical protein IT336_12770 [Thermomicrobiales bacterium]|nr:hypothetical protein [Thermomicrobiales bacterium]